MQPKENIKNEFLAIHTSFIQHKQKTKHGINVYNALKTKQINWTPKCH